MTEFNETQKISVRPHVKLFVIPHEAGFIITDSKGNGFLTIQPTIEDVEKRVGEVEVEGVEVRVFFHLEDLK
jgi:hypothetical protein